MRIAMITSTYPYGGADQVAMTLVRKLEGRHEVTFITTGDEDAEFDEGNHRRIIVALPRNQRFWHHYSNPSVVRKLRQHLEALKPDLVHFHSVANRTFSAEALLVSLDYPTVWSLHDVWSQCVWHKPHPPQCERMRSGCRVCRAMPLLSMTNRWLKERVWRQIDVHLVLCAEYMKRYFTHSALGSKPTTVIPNGVDLSRFEGLDPQAARSELDIPQDARVILFIGNMTIPVKGHRELLKIARRIVEEQNDVWLIFVGRHREPPAGHERIRYTGAVPADRIPGILAAADVFAFPSHAEYAPLVVLEAMAAGTPPVAYDVGGVPEQIVDAETGFVVEQENETEFEAKLRWLNDDADLRRSMGAAARKRAQEHFSVDLQVERTERLYEDVVARSGATRQEHGV